MLVVKDTKPVTNKLRKQDCRYFGEKWNPVANCHGPKFASLWEILFHCVKTNKVKSL